MSTYYTSIVWLVVEGIFPIHILLNFLLLNQNYMRATHSTVVKGIIKKGI